MVEEGEDEYTLNSEELEIFYEVLFKRIMEIMKRPDVDAYSEVGCEYLFSVEEFANTCGVDPAFVSKTFRTGTKNCYVSGRHIEDRTSTAGIEATRYDSAEKATEEFDRRLKVRMVGASDKTIPGARTYEFDQVGSHNIEFVKDDSIVSVHSSIALCPEDKIVELAKIIGKRV